MLNLVVAHHPTFLFAVCLGHKSTTIGQRDRQFPPLYLGFQMQSKPLLGSLKCLDLCIPLNPGPMARRHWV